MRTFLRAFKILVDENMLIRLFRVTLIALLLFITLAPTIAPTTTASPKPSVVFAPPTIPPFTPAMPLPAPTFNGTSPMATPVSGVLHILVIAAAFSDINYTVSPATIRQEWFGPGAGSVASYYHEISYGSVTLQGDVFGWYKLPYPESHYGMDCLGVDDADCSGSDQSWQIANDAALLAQKNASLNFNSYDHFVFIHSGNGEESSGVKNDVWSVTYLGGVYVRTNTRTLTKFNVDPELEANGAVPFGVYCHEFGHNLGLPDLYNTSNGQTIMGPWELMDKGLWNGNPPGASPAHMGAWDKIQLGFVSGSLLATANAGITSTYTVDPTEIASSNIHVIQIPLTNPSQYYLVEVRSMTGFDAALPTQGVLITYVDDTALIGRIHVMNGHPTVSNLLNAVWDVGQTFSDTKNNVAVAVTGKVGSSYQVTVNRGGSPPPPPNQNNQTQTYVDLAIVNVTAQPQVITTPNTTVTINIQISNLGTGTAPNFKVQVNLNFQPYTTLQVNSVNAGASTQISFTWISVIGSHTFQVNADPNNATGDTNRANNIVSFTLSVGPTLTINFPLSLTSTSLWVSVNGQKYNVTSTQFQLSVPNGTITVQIEPAVNTSRGIRGLFASWSDGITANPRQISVTSNTALQPVYTTQYLLAVDSSGGSATPSGWYNRNANITVSASNPSNLILNASRLLFNGWSGDMVSNSTVISIEMVKPVSLKASWITQYYVTVISPAGSPSGGGWYTQGQIATVSVQSTVQYSNGTRQIFNGWNSTSLGRNPSGKITVNSPTTLRAAWKTQYLVTVTSPYGKPSGSGWYDIGSAASISIQPEIDYSNATRRLFNGWSGDTITESAPNMTVRVDAPRTLNAQWSTQYQITLKVNGLPNATLLKLNLNSTYYDFTVNSKYQTWYPKGATLNPTLNQTVPAGYMMYKFSGWQNSTGATVNMPLTVNAPQTFVASYSSEFNLPPIPGYPVEAIILGMLLGLFVLAFMRRKSEQSRGTSKRRDLHK